MRKDELMRYDLQFFAEDTGSSGEDTTPLDDTSGTNEPENETTKTYEDALAEIAAAKAETKKMKAERDAALKKAGDSTKALRAKQSEEERKAEEEQAKLEERNEYIKGLEEYKARNEAKNRYLIQGMDAELAAQAAEAEISGDMDALADIQKKHTESLIKAKEAEWKKNAPRVNFSSDSSMTKEEIMAIADEGERQRAIAQHLDLFN
jgi:hypothetical protein